MKIIILKSCRIQGEHYAADRVAEVDDKIAQQLINMRRAEKTKKKVTPASAEKPEAETKNNQPAKGNKPEQDAKKAPEEGQENTADGENVEKAVNSPAENAQGGGQKAANGKNANGKNANENQSDGNKAGGGK